MQELLRYKQFTIMRIIFLDNRLLLYRFSFTVSQDLGEFPISITRNSKINVSVALILVKQDSKLLLKDKNIS
jgi:hypothetical protein